MNGTVFEHLMLHVVRHVEKPICVVFYAEMKLRVIQTTSFTIKRFLQIEMLHILPFQNKVLLQTRCQHVN